MMGWSLEIPVKHGCRAEIPWLRVTEAISDSDLQAEGTGFEPATPFGAPDFESGSSPFGYPPASFLIIATFQARRQGYETQLCASWVVGALLV